MEKKTLGMTKEQSAQLQGLAILLMIHHHFFNDLSIYGESLSFWDPQWVVRFAWFGKICVGVFAFVSGYGMCKVLEQKKGSVIRPCLQQILGLLLRYWAVLLLFMGLFFDLGRRTFVWKEFLRNFFCIETSYNGAFWYVQQYVMMLLMLALWESFLRFFETLRSKGWKVSSLGKGGGAQAVFFGCLILGGLVWLLLAIILPGPREALKSFLDLIRIAFVLIFFVGWLLAKAGAFEWLFSKLSKLATGVRVLLGVFLVALVMAVRMLLADSPAYARLDFLFVPVFIVGTLLLLGVMAPIASLLGGVGHLCAYLWLTHLFTYELTKDWLLGLVNSHLLFWLLELIPCFLVASAFLSVEYGVLKFRKVIFQKHTQTK